LTALSDGGTAANCVSPSVPTSTASCLIDSALATGSKSGYVFAYSPASGASITTYTVNGDPISSGASGQRHFYSDQTNVIRVNVSAAASNTDPSI